MSGQSIHSAHARTKSDSEQAVQKSYQLCSIRRVNKAERSVTLANQTNANNSYSYDGVRVNVWRGGAERKA